MARSSILLLLVVLLQVALIVNARTVRYHRRYVCDAKKLAQAREASGSALNKWPAKCRLFIGDLLLRTIDIETADFTHLEAINGRIVIVGTNFVSLPYMPSLKRIYTRKRGPGIIIVNNPLLRDIEGFADWNKRLKVKGTRMPIMMSGNPHLDTVNFPKLFHTPYKPISCERRLTPQYNMRFAEGKSLFVVIMLLVFSITIFLYPLSMGSTNIYFVPGYHKV